MVFGLFAMQHCRVVGSCKSDIILSNLQRNKTFIPRNRIYSAREKNSGIDGMKPLYIGVIPAFRYSVELVMCFFLRFSKC